MTLIVVWPPGKFLFVHILFFFIQLIHLHCLQVLTYNDATTTTMTATTTTTTTTAPPTAAVSNGDRDKMEQA